MIVEKFLEEIYNQKDNKENIKFMTDNLSLFYVKEEYEKLMEILLKFEIGRCPLLFSIGLLTFTNPILPLERIVPEYCEEIHDINKMRQSFLERCKEHFKNDYEKARCFENQKILTYVETKRIFEIKRKIV